MNGMFKINARHIRLPCLLCWLLACRAVHAATDVLDWVDITQGVDQSTIHIHLNIPVSYKSHAPKHSGDFLRISVEPQPSPGIANDVLLGAEYIQWNANRQVPLLDVIYVGEGLANTAISLRFQKEVQFEIVRTADLRTLDVVIKHPQTGSQAMTGAIHRNLEKKTTRDKDRHWQNPKLRASPQR